MNVMALRELQGHVSILDSLVEIYKCPRDYAARIPLFCVLRGSSQNLERTGVIGDRWPGVR